MAGLLLLGMLLGACTTAGGSSASNNASGTPGVTPIANGGSRAVGERPPAIPGLPQGTPLPAGLILPLNFHLVYNDGAMEQDVARIYTPGSPGYHQFLTPAQILGRYAESDAQLSVVKRWLSDHGYRILGLDPLRASLRVEAPVSSIEASLGIQLESFTVSGHQFFLQVGTPTLSGEIAGLVQAVVGLDNFALPIFKPPFASLEHASGQNACAGYGAKLNLTRERIAAVYQENALYQQGLQGQGMSIGVAEFDEPYMQSDINTYTSCAGLGAAHIQNIQVDGPTAPGAGEGEAALDLELIAGLAPGAQIFDYQVGTQHGNIAFAQALVDLFTRVASERRVQVLSVSYGAGDGALARASKTLSIARCAPWRPRVSRSLSVAGTAVPSRSASPISRWSPSRPALPMPSRWAARICRSRRPAHAPEKTCGAIVMERRSARTSGAAAEASARTAIFAAPPGRWGQAQPAITTERAALCSRPA
jgi:kumamolisin